MSKLKENRTNESREGAGRLLCAPSRDDQVRTKIGGKRRESEPSRRKTRGSVVIRYTPSRKGWKGWRDGITLAVTSRFRSAGGWNGVGGRCLGLKMVGAQRHRNPVWSKRRAIKRQSDTRLRDELVPKAKYLRKTKVYLLPQRSSFALFC